MTMTLNAACLDLLRALNTGPAPDECLRSLLGAVRAHFGCGAVGLLKLENDVLRPIAVDGLSHETLGRRFRIAQHPRLAAILATSGAVRFPPDSQLPDPYDGLVDHHLGEPVPVHDCMGIRLDLDGQPWGALTLDALNSEHFGHAAQAELPGIALVAEIAVRLFEREEENRRLRAGLIGSDGRAADLLRQEGLEIIGRSAKLLGLLHELDVVADSDLPVLLLGETGVGKELFARRVHRASRRADGPLIHVNCAALPESLAESELFGHVRGAFSGAGGERAGRIEAADGGTLFLDEVGELPPAVQAKLLRTLQNGEIQRLGADHPHKVDVRIVAATNRDLPERIREGQFRADLYHRLSVYPVQIPPLRERGQDVLLLAGHFLEINRSRLGLRSLRLSAAAEVALCSHGWPGNVRELEHVIGRAALRAISQGARHLDIVTLEPAHFDLDLQHALPAADTIGQTRAEQLPAAGLPLKTALDAFQRDLIRQTLARCDGHWAKAARALQLDPSNLHKLARRLGLKP